MFRFAVKRDAILPGAAADQVLPLEKGWLAKGALRGNAKERERISRGLITSFPGQ